MLRSGTGSSWTLRWRGRDSNPRSPERETERKGPYGRGLPPFRAISLIAVGSTGRHLPLPQPVPLATDVVEHSLGAAEVGGDPRPIARTVFDHRSRVELRLMAATNARLRNPCSDVSTGQAGNAVRSSVLT
jgi:hypothetical protein